MILYLLTKLHSLSVPVKKSSVAQVSQPESVILTKENAFTATNLAMSLIIVFHSNKKFQSQKSASQPNCIGLTATEPSSLPDPCNAKNVKCFCFFLLFCLFNFSFMCTSLYFRPVYLIHVKSKLITGLFPVACLS